MAPHKKKQVSKQGDTNPKLSINNVSTQDVGIRLSPARTPKKLLRNKQRKQLIESLSPSPKSSSKQTKSKSPSASTSKAGTSKASSSNTPSILSFFAKAKPVQLVDCPVCTLKVPMSKINQHLDSNCLTTGDTTSGSSVVLVESSEDSDIKTVSVNKKGRKNTTQSSPGRRKADLKNDAKDKRTRLRLKKKIKSHALYQSIDSSDSVIESGCEMQTQIDVDTQDVSLKKKVHRELFSDDDPNSAGPSRMTSHSRGKSKLSLKRNHSTGTKSKSSSISSVKGVPIKTKEATSNKSPYWQQTSGSSDDCFIVSSKPSGDSGLSPSKKLTQKVSLLKTMTFSDDHKPPTSKPSKESLVPDISNQRTPDGSPSKVQHHGVFHKSPAARDPKKLTPKYVKSPLLNQSFSKGIPSNKTAANSPNSVGTPSSLKRKHSSENIGNTSKHLESPSADHLSSKRKQSSTTVINSPSKHNQPSPSHRLPQMSSQKKYSLNSPHRHQHISTGHQNSPTRSFNSPNRPVNSPNGAQATTSTYRTPVKSPFKSSQPVSPAPSSTSSTNSPSKRDPYYLANFKLIFLTVLGNEDDKSLFSEEDLAYVNSFKNLSGPAQQLYVRLFQRKHAWIRAAKLDYPKIAADLKPAISELQAVQFLQAEKDLTNIEEALHLLPAPDVKTLAKSMRVSSASWQKSELVPALLKHSRQQRSIFNVNMQQVVMKKARELLGSCVRLHNEPRTVFSRILLLFSLAVNMEDEDQASGGQTQMQTLLMVNMGRVSYPMYTVLRTRKIFRNREDLIRYEEANQYEQDILAAMGTNDFELALQFQQAAKDRFKTIQEDEDISSHDQSLPPFLRHFTASWMYTRLLFTGVEIHQKMRCYGDAVAGLRSLLGQTMYCMDSRGRWWDRLALNLDHYLKKPNEALDAILEALADPFVTTGHRLALQQRAQKIFSSRSNKKLLDRQEEFTFDDIRELPKVTIQGQVLPFQAPGVKNTFVRRLQGGSSSSGGDDTDMAICSVEQVALQHYKDLGYDEGVHGEGSVFTTLIFLLFLDIVFMSGIPDVFSYPYQSAPLDIRYSSFYECRKEAIDEKLQELSQADNATLQTLLESSWKEHEGESVVGVSWELFRDIDHAKGLLECLGGKVLCAIAARILKSHRHTRAGMPDLTVWNTETHKYKVVEVKGPGDRPSQKQILWIDYLLGLGVETEVCHVQASGKRLRLN